MRKAGKSPLCCLQRSLPAAWLPFRNTESVQIFRTSLGKPLLESNAIADPMPYGELADADRGMKTMHETQPEAMRE
jgi:hypothetical protein